MTALVANSQLPYTRAAPEGSEDPESVGFLGRLGSVIPSTQEPSRRVADAEVSAVRSCDATNASEVPQACRRSCGRASAARRVARDTGPGEGPYHGPHPAVARSRGYMSFAYLIVAYRSESDLPACLDALEADRPDDATIIVVDNASPDDSANVARRHPSRPEIVASARNLGFGGGCNLGVAATEADTIFLVNPDARVLPGATMWLREALADDPGLGVVAPRIIDPHGEFRSTAGGAEPSLRSLVGHYLLLGRVPWVRRFFRPFHLVDTDVETRADWVSGGAMMLRRAAYDAVGGFDERWFMYMEDVDLCRRIRAAGWTVGYMPDAVVEHAIGGSQSEGQPRRWYIAFDRYLRLNRGSFRARLCAVIVAVGLGMRWVAYRKTRPANARRVGEGARAALSLAIGRHKHSTGQGPDRPDAIQGHDLLNSDPR